MDNLTVMTTSVPGCKWHFQGLISWTRMGFKPVKSRFLVIKKGRVTIWFCFTLGGTQIPTVTEKTVNSLFKVSRSSLKDKTALQHAKNDSTASVHPGKIKAWMNPPSPVKATLAPLIYKVPMTTMEATEKTVSQFLQWWNPMKESPMMLMLAPSINVVQEWWVNEVWLESWLKRSSRTLGLRS